MKCILVCGGRNYNNRESLFSVLDYYLQFYGSVLVIHGGAKGAGSLAGQWAAYREIPCLGHPAKWKEHMVKIATASLPQVERAM
jgi:hypothetical protein